MTTAEILIVGDEILHGEITDQNGPWLIEQLSDAGVDVHRMSVLPDEVETVAPEVRRGSQEADVVLVTGGIGPTHDDRTRRSVAVGLDREQSMHDEVLEWLNHYYGEAINDARRRMANLPEDSEAILLKDTPAIAFRTDNVHVFPGIPDLMKPLFQQWGDEFTGDSRVVETLTVRAREGDVAEPLDEVQFGYPDCSIGCYPHPDGTLTIKVRGRKSETIETVREELESVLAGIAEDEEPEKD